MRLGNAPLVPGCHEDLGNRRSRLKGATENNGLQAVFECRDQPIECKIREVKRCNLADGLRYKLYGDEKYAILIEEMNRVSLL